MPVKKADLNVRMRQANLPDVQKVLELTRRKDIRDRIGEWPTSEAALLPYALAKNRRFLLVALYQNDVVGFVLGRKLSSSGKAHGRIYGFASILPGTGVRMLKNLPLSFEALVSETNLRSQKCFEEAGFRRHGSFTLEVKKGLKKFFYYIRP